MSEHSDYESEDSGECSPVEELAEQYLERLRNGERPRVSEYADAYPELAEEIQDVFRTLAMLEDLAPDHHEDDSFDARLTAETPKKLGDYRIVRELGRGGMGVVYEAEHGVMRRRVALKVLHVQAVKSGQDLKRFMREARSAGRLHHTNIVPVFEVGSDNDIHFYSMQCIRGQNLDLVINDLKRFQGGNDCSQIDLTEDKNESASAARCLLSGQFERPEMVDDEATEDFDFDAMIAAREAAEEQGSFAPPLSEPVHPNTSELSNVGEGQENFYHRVARVGLQVADALAYAHEQGVLHRDIKPANLILDTVGTVWITDFGLARSEGDDLTHTGDIVGTLRYMAPERFRGEADARSDIYSLGLTLYELCTLKYAFDRRERAELIRQVTREDAVRPRRINPLIPRDLETIILKCMEREPARRYRKAKLLADDLRLFLSDRPIQARRATFMEQSWRWCRRNPFVASALSCIVLLLAVIVFGTLNFALQTDRLNDELLSKRALAQRAFDAEKKAFRNSRAMLYQSLYRQAQAERRNQLTGRLDNCLAALAEAAAILPELSLSSEETQHERLLLRNEAVAALGRTGISLAHDRMSEDIETRSIVYDSDYERYAISRGRIEIRRASSDELLQVAPQLQFRATDLIFSAEDRYLGTLHRRDPDEPRFVRVWDLKEERALIEKETQSSDICFSPGTGGENPPHFAFISSPSIVTVYKACRDDQVFSHDFGFNLQGICFVGENQIAAAGDATEVVIWSVVDGSTETMPIAVRGRRVSWCQEKNLLAVGYQSGTIDVFDLNQQSQRIAELKGHDDDVLTLSLSPNGDLAASTSWDGTSRLWDIRRQSEFKRLESHIIHSGFSRDDKYICCGAPDGQICVYEISRNSPKHVYEDERQPLRHRAVDFHPKKPTLAAVATGSHVEVWDLMNSNLEQFIKTERTFVARFSEDGRRLMTSGRRGLRIWRTTLPMHSPWTETIATEGRFLTDFNTYYADAASDLSRIVFVDGDGVASIVEPDSPMSRIELSTSDVYKVAISPDGQWVVTIQVSGRGLIVWNAETGQRVTELCPDAASTMATFSRDGRWLVGSNSKGQFLWEAGTWDVVKHRPLMTGPPGTVAISPDNRLIVMPRDRFSLELLAADTMTPLVALDTDDRRLASSARFSADGTKLAITSLGHFEVWDIPELRRRLRQLKLDWNDVNSVSMDDSVE